MSPPPQLNLQNTSLNLNLVNFEGPSPSMSLKKDTSRDLIPAKRPALKKKQRPQTAKVSFNSAGIPNRQDYAEADNDYSTPGGDVQISLQIKNARELFPPAV